MNKQYLLIMQEMQDIPTKNACQPKKGKLLWVKGQSGNPAGRKPERVLSVWERASRKLKDDPERVDKLADVFLGMLEAGHWGAWQDYLDRTEGKVGSSLTIKDERAPNPLDGLVGAAFLEMARKLLGGEVGVVPQVDEVMDAELVALPEPILDDLAGESPPERA